MRHGKILENNRSPHARRANWIIGQPFTCTVLGTGAGQAGTARPCRPLKPLAETLAANEASDAELIAAR